MKVKTVTGLLSLLITLPIWFYLMYVCLKAANADRLVWFLYYIYVPVTVIVSIMQKVIEGEK